MAAPATIGRPRTPSPQSPHRRLAERKQVARDLHLLTYVVGNALFWALWGAISVSADTWYWWAVVPIVGWTLVFALHLWHTLRATRPN
jgi:2TM domain